MQPIDIVEPRLRPLHDPYRVILKEDLANVLAALLTSETRHDDYYKALIRVAMAFGINVDTPPEPQLDQWRIEPPQTLEVIKR